MSDQNTINTPKDGSRYLCDASINTEAWLERIGVKVASLRDETASWDNDLEVLLMVNHDHNTSLKYDAEEAEILEWRYRDNVYNHENDFDQIFTFSIYTYGDGSDYLYHDTAYVAVCLHRGGDARGNYGNVVVYKLNQCVAESGFLDWCIGWYVTDDSEKLIDNDGRYDVGYSNNPTNLLESELATDTDDSFEWKDGYFSAVLETKNTEKPTIKVRCHPRH